MSFSSSDAGARITVSTLPANASDWVVILFILRYLTFSAHNTSGPLEHLVQRPQLNVNQLLRTALFHLTAATSIAGSLSFLLGASILWGIAGVVVYVTVVCLLKSQSLVIWLIRFYQAKAKAEVRLRCKMKPSCSEYMAICVRQHGVVAGVRKGLERVRSCGDSRPTESGFAGSPATALP